MRVTSKGQVTIPIAIRRQLDIGPDTQVTFEVVGEVVHMRKVQGSGGRGSRIVERLREATYDGPSTEELMALTRGDPA